MLLALVAFWLVLTCAFPTERKTIGVSAEWVNGEYRFAGGTEPAALLFAVLMIGMYALLLSAEQSGTGKPVPGVFRRFVAFWLDFLVAMSVVGPLMGVVPTLVEWRRTGLFQWTFERTTSARGDALQVSLLLPVTFVWLVFYYALPLLRKHPSPGACIMGYRVVPDDGTTLTVKTATLRTVLGFIAACAAYLAPFIGRDRKQGKFWLDKVFSTHAVTLE